MCHDGMFLSDKECLLSISVCNMYVYAAVWYRYNLGLLRAKYCRAHSGLRSICANKQRSGGSGAVFENGSNGVRAVIITDVFELFAILRSVSISRRDQQRIWATAYLNIDSLSTQRSKSPSRHTIHTQEWNILYVFAGSPVPSR